MACLPIRWRGGRERSECGWRWVRRPATCWASSRARARSWSESAWRWALLQRSARHVQSPACSTGSAPSIRSRSSQRSERWHWSVRSRRCCRRGGHCESIRSSRSKRSEKMRRAILAAYSRGVALNIDELRERARRKLPTAVFDFIDGAAEDEVTLRRNREAYARYALVPRVGIDVSAIDIGVTVLGQRLSLPLLLAPTGLCGMATSRGEIPAARAATEAGSFCTLSR